MMPATSLSNAMAISHERGDAAAQDAVNLGTADWLCLAATPTFAIMALLTWIFSWGQSDWLCSALPSVFPLGGMVPMYVLMSAFHAPPWLKLIANRRNAPTKHPLA
jgi:hypothetical protein